MGTPTHAPWPTGVWKQHLAEAVTEPNELLALVGLGCRSQTQTPAAASRFPLRVPRGFVSRMRRGDPDDPLLRQVLPVGSEDEDVEGFTADPVGELKGPSQGGVITKYRGRALVVATGACAVHCRYCFRRHFPYAEIGLTGVTMDRVLDRFAKDSSITEVILSGGDPLLVSERTLAELTKGLEKALTLRRIRIHTRLPVVIPQRVDVALMSWIEDLGVPLVVVVHVNHAREIDDHVRRAMAVLAGSGATLLNQSVLLEGVNDQVGDLVDLSEALFDAGVLPYYLHMLDPVAGAAHFQVSEDRARGLFSELAARLPGYLVPRLVREIPGAAAKISIDLWE